uniref:C-type lectin domain-containing protein n=1 Tax=Acrobeloides nanus TaxID=290746 RepID=A0A914EJB3_9BILA
MSINPSSGTWYSQSCSDSFPYICKINSTASISTCTTPSSIPASTLKPSNPCTEDYTYFNVTNKCYKLYKQALSFDSAEAERFEYNVSKILHFLVFGYGSPFWIGMHYEDSAWRWTDSTSVDYMHWGRTTPAGGLLSCVFIDMGYVDSTGFDWFGYWDNYYPCSQQWWAICKKDPL